MVEKYRLYYDEVTQNKNLIDKEEPLTIEVFSNSTKQWTDVKLLISRKAKEGWDVVKLVGIFGNVVEDENYYIKILEELADEDDDLI